LREVIPVNAIVPAVSPAVAEGLVRESGCNTVKVKVAADDGTLADDVARVDAVRNAVGPSGKIRIDANGAWSIDEATNAMTALAHCELEYVEQPCATMAECAELRRRVSVPVAIDEGIRKAADPQHVGGVQEAADVVIVKVAPLGGVAAALDVVARYGIPAVVSSALDTSVGLAAGAALAASLPDLPYACGLGSGLLLGADVARHRILPSQGSINPVAPVPDADSLAAVGVSAAQMAGWQTRLADAYCVLAKRTDVEQGGAR
jgi:O-succinylbenzoate synthase